MRFCSTRTSSAIRRSTPSRSKRRTRRLFQQYLFSYKLNPQTVLFVGYSDNASNVNVPSIDLQQTNRTLFIKIGYAIVF